MARQAQFTSQAFVDAAIELVAEGGGSAATLQAIARKVGGPTGSIYHRFQSRAEIMATAWISIHGQFSRRLRSALEQGGAVAAALAIPDWARRDAVRARNLDPAVLAFGYLEQLAHRRLRQARCGIHAPHVVNDKRNS